MLHENWWEEYKNETVIMDKYDDPIDIILFLIIIAIVGIIVEIILNYDSLNLNDIYNKIIVLLIIIALSLKVGDSIRNFCINNNKKKKLKEDKQIFYNCLKRNQKNYNSKEIENFLDLTCINNEVEKNDLFKSTIFPIICSYLFAIPTMSEDNNNDKSSMYSSVIIVIISFLAIKYIFDFLYDILSKNKRFKRDEYALAIIAKNHLYNIRKEQKESNLTSSILKIVEKLKQK